MRIKNIFGSIFKDKQKLKPSHNATANLISKIEASEYFDADWYVQTNSDIDFDNVSPIEHFLDRGYLENRDPSLRFSLSAYLKINPDVAVAKVNPLIHYIEYGKKEVRKISPDLVPVPESPPISMQQELESIVLSDDQLTVYNQLEAKTDFQGNWYATTYSHLEIDEYIALKHYLLFGADENFDPTPLFSTKDYKKQQEHLIDGGVNPFWHYHMIGRTSGIKAVRSLQSVDKSTNNIIASYVLSVFQKVQAKVFSDSQWFDSKWYVENIIDDEVDIQFAIKHYILLGEIQGKDPCPLFSTKFYLQTHPDVAKSGLNSLFHYISHGLDEKRHIRKSDNTADVSLEQNIERYELTVDESKDVAFISNSKWFSKNWYVDTYPELNISSNKAAKHYYLFGVNEERDPCPHFSTSFYLMNNADVAAAGVNPLLHYVNFGQGEKRAIVGSKYARLDLSGNIMSSNSSGLVSLDYSHIHQNCIQSDEIPQLNSENLQQVQLGDNEVGEVASEVASAVKANCQLFELLCQSYAVEIEKVEAWETETIKNQSQFLQDVCIVNNHSLLLRFESSPLVGKLLSIEAYQYEIGTEVIKLVSSSTLNVTSLNLSDLELSSQFQPVILLFKVEAQIVQSHLLPFPSLIRGGVHFDELCLQSTVGTNINLRSIAYSKELIMDCSGADVSNIDSRIKVSLQYVIGNEELFNRNFMDWLKRYFNIRYIGYMAKPKTQLETQRQSYLSEIVDISHDSASESRVNVIDRDALPTLKLVTNIGRINKTQGASVIVPESMTEGTAKIVKLESIINNTSDVSFCGDNVNYTSFPSSVVQHIRSREDAIEMMPMARDHEANVKSNIQISMSIILIIKDNNQDHQAKLWETIRTQKGIEDIDVVLGLDNPIDSHIYLPNGFNNQYQILKRSNDETHQAFYKRCVDVAKYDLITHTVESAI
ncbi:MAG: hypothetical protein ABJH28_05930, partial [Paraglaciecola sp.]